MCHKHEKSQVKKATAGGQRLLSSHCGGPHSRWVFGTRRCSLCGLRRGGGSGHAVLGVVRLAGVEPPLDGALDALVLRSAALAAAPAAEVRRRDAHAQGGLALREAPVRLLVEHLLHHARERNEGLALWAGRGQVAPLLTAVQAALSAVPRPLPQRSPGAPRHAAHADDPAGSAGVAGVAAAAPRM